MIGYVISLSLLIAAVILIRAIFRKTVSSRVIYALWLVVIIRMVLPVSLFQVNVRFPESAPVTQTQVTEQQSPGQAVPVVPATDPAVNSPAVNVPQDQYPSVIPAVTPVTDETVTDHAPAAETGPAREQTPAAETAPGLASPDGDHVLRKTRPRPQAVR